MGSESDDFTDHSPCFTSLVSTIKGSNSEEGVIHRRGEQIIQDSSQLHQQVATGTLPGDVLLKIFKIFISEINSYYYTRERWRTLVHICRRWRNLVFESPRHLNLELLYRPSKRSVKEMLDIWPELPIYIWVSDYKMETSNNVVAALRLNHRVSGMRFDSRSNSAWETFAPLMQQPFPALTDLWVRPYFPKRVISTLLGGSAPCLRVLHLCFPSSGYMSPQEMVTRLSALTRLQSLSLTFQPVPFPYRAIQIPPPHTRTLLPALTNLYFQGDPEYVEDLVAQVNTPLLESTKITFFHREVLEVSGLSKFIRRADKLSLIDRAEVTFESGHISITLSQELLKSNVDPKTLRLYLNCPESVLRLSYLSQLCASCLPTLSAFKSLHIHVALHHPWQDVIDDPDPQWLDLLRLFNTVQELHLSKYVAPRVAQVLRGLRAERATEVLPALETLSISRLKLRPLLHVTEAISEFARARQLSCHPAFLSSWDEGAHYWG